jgi:uncharacterized protein YyaL (SSP411 family)
MPGTKNKLGQETSPYLLQHADNPVYWYPWSQEALKLARDEDKPILLSIGYSACHWCHVMAHESFEDDKTAAIMNQYFINIKVDREERPDLDKIYQKAHQAMTERGGGWPLTMMLSPQDQAPFFAGTYFPSTPRHGMRSFSDILISVQRAWMDRRSDIQRHTDSIKAHLLQISAPEQRVTDLQPKVFEIAEKQLMSHYDSTHGGFSGAPKFPHPYLLERTFRQAYFYGSRYETLREAGLFSAKKMAQGGVFDHVGGGFCRYSTDELWMIPHFEKMLYDNGQLMPLYCWAQQVQADTYFEQAVTRSASWLMQEMQAAEGGYYSAQDADSEGEEGKFYSWTKEQVIDLLDDEEYSVFSRSFGLDRKANFEGKWYPHTFEDIEQLARQDNRSVSAVQVILDACKQKLYEKRDQRIHPGTDDKILTSWNALMIRGMNIAARTFNRPDYALSASRALKFIRQTHWQDGRLLATSKNGKAHLNAYLDDYAYLILAIVDALQNEWDSKLYNWAIELADTMLALFEDSEQGGFYFTSVDHEQLLVRSKTFSDDAMPSGYGIDAQALLYLVFLSAKTDYLQSAENTLLAASADINRQPILYASLLNALDNYLNPATIIILRGDQQAMQAWQKCIFVRYLPDVLCFAISDDIELPPELRDKKAIGNGVCAYICEGLSCSQPVTETARFELIVNKLLNKNLSLSD